MVVELVLWLELSFSTILYVLSYSTVAYHLTLCSNNIGTLNETMNSCLLLSFFFICTNLKRLPYINCIILTEGVVNRTIHNKCMYINRLLTLY